MMWNHLGGEWAMTQSNIVSKIVQQHPMNDHFVKLKFLYPYGSPTHNYQTRLPRLHSYLMVPTEDQPSA